MSGILVCYSGGVESSICLLVAASAESRVAAITFDYGQRNAREVEHAKLVCEFLGVPHMSMRVGLPDVMDSALLSSCSESWIGAEAPLVDGRLQGIHPRCRDGYIPGRNIVFAHLAAMVAASRGYDSVYLGVMAGGSGYPDTTSKSADAAAQSIRSMLLDEESVRLHCPLQGMNKGEVVRFALEEFPCTAESVLLRSYTCHNNVEPPGCGTCLTCEDRIRAFRSSGSARLEASVRGFKP